MDHDVAKTLGELERKLLELERTLATIGHEEQRGEATVASDAPNPPTWGRLVDETIERNESALSSAPLAPRAHASTPQAQVPAPSYTPPRAAIPGYTPPQAATPGYTPPQAATPGYTPPQAATPGYTPPQAATPGYTPPQAATPGYTPTRAASSGYDEPPSAAELLRFRDQLERTARELTHDYDELLRRISFAAVPAPAPPTISFARGAPSLDIIDVDGLRDAAVRAFESDPAGTTAYGTSVGYPRLRAWIADRHGVQPEHVLVTNGSMQADAFLFEHLVHPGDEVLVERPTYDRTLLALRLRGARLHAIELLPDGIDTNALSRLLSGGAGARPKLAHIIPNFQNPAGYTLSLAKRHALLELAAAHGFVVFEDDPYVALRFSGETLPTMLSMDPDRVVYASSFSKTVCPGIRVGYLVGPTELIDAVAQLATNTYISPDMVAQAIVYEFCASGAIERSIETVKRALAERAETLANALRRELADAEFVPPQGGYFMWVTLPEGTDVHALHRAATERGVAFVKGTDFLMEGGENTLRLAYAGVTPDQIDEGVTRLAAAYRSL